MALPSWEERQASWPWRPEPFDIRDVSSDVPLGDNNATEVLGRIYDTIGNTPLNRSKGRLVELPGKFTYHGDPFANEY